MVVKPVLPLEIWELDPLTGVDKLFKTFAAESLPGTGVIPWASRITPDGKTLAITYFRNPATLYLVEGLK